MTAADVVTTTCGTPVAATSNTRAKSSPSAAKLSDTSGGKLKLRGTEFNSGYMQRARPVATFAASLPSGSSVVVKGTVSESGHDGSPGQRLFAGRSSSSRRQPPLLLRHRLLPWLHRLPCGCTELAPVAAPDCSCGCTDRSRGCTDCSWWRQAALLRHRRPTATGEVQSRRPQELLSARQFRGAKLDGTGVAPESQYRSDG